MQSPFCKQSSASLYMFFMSDAVEAAGLCRRVVLMNRRRLVASGLLLIALSSVVWANNRGKKMVIPGKGGKVTGMKKGLKKITGRKNRLKRRGLRREAAPFHEMEYCYCMASVLGFCGSVL